MHNVAQLRRLREKFPDELVIIGVHSAKFPSEHLTANIRQAILREDIRHPVVNDTGFRIWSEYNVHAWPTVVLIDPRGRIAGEAAGEIQADDFIPIIDRLIAENRDILDKEPLQLTPEEKTEPERPLRFPTRVLVTDSGKLWIADSGHNRIIEVHLDSDGLSGEVIRIFGSGIPGLKDGSIEQAQFQDPHGIALRGSPENGSLYVADTGNHAIRRIDLKDGQVQRVAGSGHKASGPFSLGNPLDTPLRSPWALSFLGSNLLIAMAGSHQIWVFTEDGQLGPFAGNGYEALVDGPLAQASFNQPSDLALAPTQLFVADPEASAIRSILLDASPSVITLVGEGLFEYGDRDGVGPEVRLQHPAGIAYADRLVYIADTYNNKIKILDPLTRRVKTLMGNGKAGRQDGPFRQAQFYEPEGLQVLSGRLYVADTNNHQIRVASLSTNKVSTFQLREIERLGIPDLQPGQAVQLPTQQVSPGDVTVHLDLQLPEGYKRNPEAEAQLMLDENGKPRRFKASEPIAFPVKINQDTTLRFQLSVIFCASQDQALCLIDNREATLPVKVKTGAPHEIHVLYPIPLPALEG